MSTARPWYETCDGWGGRRKRSAMAATSGASRGRPAQRLAGFPPDVTRLQAPGSKRDRSAGRSGKGAEAPPSAQRSQSLMQLSNEPTRMLFSTATELDVTRPHSTTTDMSRQVRSHPARTAVSPLGPPSPKCLQIRLLSRWSVPGSNR